MRLFFRRSQRVSGVFSSTPVFALDARIELTKEENQLIRQYQLNKEILYSSEDAKKHGTALGDALNQTGFQSLAKAALSGAMPNSAKPVSTARGGILRGTRKNGSGGRARRSLRS